MGQIQSQLTNMLGSVAHMARLAKVESSVQKQGKEQKERLANVENTIKKIGSPSQFMEDAEKGSQGFQSVSQFMSQAMNPDKAANGAQQSTSSSQATINNKVQQKERIQQRLNQIKGGVDDGSDND